MSNIQSFGIQYPVNIWFDNIPHASGIEGTMAWLDSVVLRHYIAEDYPSGIQIRGSGLAWKRYNGQELEGFQPKTGGQLGLDGYPIYHSGFWDQFKTYAKFVGRKIGRDWDNTPYENVATNLTWSGGAQNPFQPYGLFPNSSGRRDVNVSMFDAGQPPKYYYETFIAKNTPTNLNFTRDGYTQTFTRGTLSTASGNPIRAFSPSTPTRKTITLSYTVTTSKEKDFTIYNYATVGGKIDLTPLTTVEALNTGKFGRKTLRWTIDYGYDVYEDTFDLNEDMEMLDSHFVTSGNSTFYSGPNVDYSGYTIGAAYPGIYYDEQIRVRYPPYGYQLMNLTNASTAFYFTHFDKVFQSSPNDIWFTNIVGLSGKSPLFSRYGNMLKRAEVCYKNKYAFGNIPGSGEIYDITRMWGIRSSSNYDAVLRLGKEISRYNGSNSFLNVLEYEFGDLYLDYTYYSGVTSGVFDTNYVINTPCFANDNGNVVKNFGLEVSGARYPVSINTFGLSGIIFEDRTESGLFKPMIDDHDKLNHSIITSQYIEPYAVTPDLVTVRGLASPGVKPYKMTLNNVENPDSDVYGIYTKHYHLNSGSLYGAGGERYDTRCDFRFEQENLLLPYISIPDHDFVLDWPACSSISTVTKYKYLGLPNKPGSLMCNATPGYSLPMGEIPTQFGFDTSYGYGVIDITNIKYEKDGAVQYDGIPAAYQSEQLQITNPNNDYLEFAYSGQKIPAFGAWYLPSLYFVTRPTTHFPMDGLEIHLLSPLVKVSGSQVSYPIPADGWMNGSFINWEPYWYSTVPGTPDNIAYPILKKYTGSPTIFRNSCEYVDWYPAALFNGDLTDTEYLGQMKIYGPYYPYMYVDRSDGNNIRVVDVDKGLYERKVRVGVVWPGATGSPQVFDLNDELGTYQDTSGTISLNYVSGALYSTSINTDVGTGTFYYNEEWETLIDYTVAQSTAIINPAEVAGSVAPGFPGFEQNIFDYPRWHFRTSNTFTKTDIPENIFNQVIV